MITLSTGRKIEIDLSKVTRLDYKKFVDPRGNLSDEDTFVSKACGMTIEQVNELSEPEFRELVQEIFNERNSPKKK